MFLAEYNLPFFLSLFVILGCQRNELPLPIDEAEITNEQSEEIYGLVTAETTLLGTQRVNPYTVTNMTTAWNNLYSNEYTALPTTHKYVRFLPANADEMRILSDLDLIIYDYPLDYEVTSHGEYYHDPSIPADEITWQYAVVEPTFDFPSIQYEILADLVLVPYDSYLAAEAFRITGNDYSGFGNGPDGFTPCPPDCPNWPDCAEDPNVPCEDTPPPPPGGGGGGGDPASPCDPSSPDWPDCLMVPFDEDPNNGGNFGNTTTTNACGCEVYANPRKPGGCVILEDTQFPDPVGVNNVKVIVKDDWFGSYKTYTDENGCWKINRIISNKFTWWVKFKSERVVIRGIRGAKVWEYSLGIKDKVEEVATLPFNDEESFYTPSNDDQGTSKLYWYAATANNALYEFDGFAAQDGIAIPPAPLEILLTNYEADPSAPMFAQISKNPLVAIGAFGLTYSTISLSSSSILFIIFQQAGGVISSTVSALLSAYIVAFLPDVTYSYGAEIDKESDKVKNVFYHEYAHAAHYNALNDDLYWLGNAAEIISNGGYGDGTSPNAERIAIIEMWGFYIGYLYTDRQYGSNHSFLSSGSTGVSLNRTRWIYTRLESSIPVDPSSSSGWLPKGLFYDCSDDNSQNPFGVIEGSPIDNVKNFEILDFFQAINFSPTTMDQVKDFLIQHHLPIGETSSDIDALFLEYEW